MSASPTTYCENGSDTRRITTLQKKNPREVRKQSATGGKKKNYKYLHLFLKLGQVHKYHFNALI